MDLIDKERPVSRDVFAFPAVTAGEGRDQAKEPDVGERPQPRPHHAGVDCGTVRSRAGAPHAEAMGEQIFSSRCH